METSAADGTSSLLECTAASGINVEKDQLEYLKRQLRAVESEFTALKRAQPRLKDAHGKDCAEEIIKLDRELRLAKEHCERWRCDYAELTKKYEKFEQSSIAQIDQKDKQIEQIRRQAIELEDENAKLREMIKDEESRIFHLQQQQAHFDRSLGEVSLRGQIVGQLSRDLSMVRLKENETEEKMGSQLLNESLGDLDISDAEQIATHLLMILQKLDKNHREADELQNAIFAFLAEHGFSANPDKFAAFSNVYMEMVEKRLAVIRAGNEKLRSKMSVDDKEMEACMKHLIHDSLSLSTTHPSYAGVSKEIGAVTMHPEVSFAEMEFDQVHNLTVDSVANLANRTSHLAEACVRMFETLRGTADYFQKLLKTLGITADELGDDIMRKIESMKFDLDKSVGEARSVLFEAKDTEKNLRSVMLEQSSQHPIMSNTMYSSYVRDESKLMVNTAAGVLELENVQQQSKKCQNCQEMEQMYKSKVANMEEMTKQLIDQTNVCEQLANEKNALLAKIKELEANMCEKCAELEDLYETAKSTLESELTKKVELKKQLDEHIELNKKLKDELEQLASATKENNFISSDTRKVLIEQTREELNQIFDTMSYASSKCSSIVGSSMARKAKSAMKAKQGELQQQPRSGSE